MGLDKALVAPILAALVAAPKPAKKKRKALDKALVAPILAAPKPARKKRKALDKGPIAPILAAAPKPAKKKLDKAPIDSILAAAATLEKLDKQSAKLRRKLERLNDRKVAAHATKGWDSPVIKRLNKRVQMLSKKLCKRSKQRYELRASRRPTMS